MCLQWNGSGDTDRAKSRRSEFCVLPPLSSRSNCARLSCNETEHASFIITFFIEQKAAPIGGNSSFFPPRNTLHVAVATLHEVNIVQALRGFKRGIHHLHVQSTIRKLRVAGRARCPRLLSVSLMARETTQPFVDAHRGPIIARTDLFRD